MNGQCKLKVAVAGTGYFSQFHYDAWSRCRDVDIVGVADLDLAAAQAIADRFGGQPFDDVQTMMQAAKPDLLDVVTPPATHLDVIRLACNEGIDVICQKPFCGGLQTAKDAVEAAKDAKISLIVHENFRFQPWYRTIKGELDSGRLGKLYRASFRLRPGDGQGPEAYLERQPYFQTMKRFLVHETMIHLVDVFRYLFGEVGAIWADLAQLNPAIQGEDSCLVMLEFGQGFRGLLDGNRLSDHEAENHRRTMGELLIEGERGVLSLNGDGAVDFRAHGSNQWEPVDFEWQDSGFGGDCVYLFTRHVVDHFLHSAPIENLGQDYLINQAIEEVIYRSANDGCRITISRP